MTRFEHALSEYKKALIAAGLTARTENERLMYRIHAHSLSVIQECYSANRKARDIASLVRSARFLHESDALKGPAVQRMRAAFDLVVRLASPAARRDS